MKYKESFVEVNDEPNHKEILRNERIRIYRAVFKPGESSEFHRHSKNTLYISIQGGNITTELMKGTPSCPTVLSRSLSVIQRLFLLYQKVFTGSLNIKSGFVFYMPSARNPVIHRVFTSRKNSSDMDLLGIEILKPQNVKTRAEEVRGKVEIKTDELIAFRISLDPKQERTGEDLNGNGIIIAISGRIDIQENNEIIHLETGDYYLNSEKAIQKIENQGINKGEILYIVF